MKKNCIVRKRKFYVVRRKDGTFKKWTLVKKKSGTPKTKSQWLYKK